MNTASTGGDSEIRLLNLQMKGYEESLLAPAEAICQLLSSNFPFQMTHPPFFLAPTEATHAEREADSHPSETPDLIRTSDSSFLQGQW